MKKCGGACNRVVERVYHKGVAFNVPQLHPVEMKDGRKLEMCWDCHKAQMSSVEFPVYTPITAGPLNGGWELIPAHMQRVMA